MPRKKLIEVSLPLEAINEQSAREKSIRHGHPSTLHLWWARRPLAAARAVLFAQLVDDPSSDPSLTEDEQAARRQELHDLIRDLVNWDNVTNENLLARAREEIRRSTGGNPPAILDPFAGGGTIPLEAQRLGLEAHASDLNPVAVLINKALIEIPPTFAGRPPVFPGAAETRLGDWPRATGLAEDVRRYGAWMRDRAQERIGHLYPTATVTEPLTGKTSEATVIAWIWARTVTCPNPACGIEMPLVRSWWLGKKKGKEAYVVPEVVPDGAAPSGRRVTFRVEHDPKNAPTKSDDGTMSGRQGGVCVACGTSVSPEYIKSEGLAGQLGAQLLAVVAEGNRRRVYLTPTTKHEEAARVSRPDDVPSQQLGYDPRNLWTPAYGLTHFSGLFTNRQLVALTTFSDLVSEARQQVLQDALAAGLPRGDRLAAGGDGAEAYADAVATYLGIIVSRLTDYQSAITTWASNPQMEILRNVFARQAIPMAWDFAEGNPFGPSSGTLDIMIAAVSRAVDMLAANAPASAKQADASTRSYDELVVSTDPPYYDNIGYSDLSDFFYVWLRRSLRDIHPNLFGTMLVPKSEELVANPYRHGGKQEAEKFFETGFEHVFGRARQSASADYPITVFYAFKQAELEKEGVASTGWSTFLDGMIREGWTITATWPVRSERSGRMISVGTNALASSIVLALRPRSATAAATDRTGFLTALRAELAEALPRIRQGALAPADLRQTILGPGMAVFSRYGRVLEPDGTPMTVKTALALINQAFDELETEEDVDLDADTRFCLDWFRSYGWATRPFGDAESLAVPLGVSVDGIARGGAITSGGGKVALIKPLDLDARWDPRLDTRISLWEATCHLARAYATDGREAAARLLAALDNPAAPPGARIAVDDVQRFATRLYELMEPKDAATAGLFNGLGGAWADVTRTADSLPRPAVQDGFDFGGDDA